MSENKRFVIFATPPSLEEVLSEKREIFPRTPLRDILFKVGPGKSIIMEDKFSRPARPDSKVRVRT